MKKIGSMISDLLNTRSNHNRSGDILGSTGKTLKFFVFCLLFITAAYKNINGQRADAFNPNVDNAVRVIARQPDGKILIGGYFTSVGGQARNRLARLNEDGTLDTTFVNGSLDQPVFALAIQPDGKIVVGTVGTSGAAQMLNRLFRVNADGTPDASFNPDVRMGVYALALQTDGKIIIGGFFSSVNGQSRSNLARLNADGTFDASFALTPNGTVIVTVPQPDGKILVGGNFSTVDGSPRNRIARLNADGTLDTSFNSLTASYITSQGINDIAVQPDGKIIIGGFASNDGLIKVVARLNADGTLDATFNQNVEASASIQVNAVAVQANGKILVGRSVSAGGTYVTKLIRLNTDGTTDTAFNPNPNGSPFAIEVQPDQKILVGGGFSTIGGATRNSLARLFSDSPSVMATQFDFDGDNKSDISAFRPSNGTWYIYQSFPSQSALKSTPFGIASDRLAPADYDGDFITDIAVFREGSQAYFYILQSRTNTFRAESFGTTGDAPVPGDFDGDSKADVAVYRNGAAAGAQSYFYYRPSATTTNGSYQTIFWGVAGDKPIVGDFDGDGRQEAAVFRPSSGIWYVLRSSDSQLQSIQFGIASDKLVAADYDGDNKTDFAVYRGGTWYLQRSQLGFTTAQFGIDSDVPTPADYDGDGKADLAVFRNGVWYLNRSTAGLLAGAYSAAGDKPIPNAFVQ